MGNCLVTKLKGTVYNNNLPILDTIRLSFERGENDNPLYVSCIAGATDNVHVKVVDANGDLVQEVDITPGYTRSFSSPVAPAVYKVFITGKSYVQNISRTSGITVNLDDFSYALNANPMLSYNVVNGSLTSLYHNTGMTSLALKGLIASSTLRGELTDLLVALLQNGKSTDFSFSAKASHGYLTFLGVAVNSTMSPNDFMYCTFENGDTINVYTDSEKTNLYATYSNGSWSLVSNT